MAANFDLSKKVIADASFVLALFLPDEKIKPAAAYFLEQYEQGKVDLISSQLLNFEVINGLRTAVLRKRIKQKLAAQLVDKFLNLEIKREKVNFRQVFEMSLDFSLSVYDASYVFLAKEKGLPLVTADEKLQRKMKKELKNIILF